MEYTSIVSRPFWYIENKKTAAMMLEGLSKEEMRKRVLEGNIYQAPSEERSIQILNTVHKRLSTLDEFLLKQLVSADVSTSKLVALIALMKTDRLFFEFVYEVYREKILIGDLKIDNRDINVFFDVKVSQSTTVSKWKEGTVKRLKNVYTQILYETGLLQNSSDERPITPAFLSNQIIEHLQENGMSVYAKAILGGS